MKLLSTPSHIYKNGQSYVNLVDIGGLLIDFNLKILSRKSCHKAEGQLILVWNISLQGPFLHLAILEKNDIKLEILRQCKTNFA